MKVLCFGSLNIDYTYKVDHFVQKGETIASVGLNVSGGGKGLNQSIALAKAGVEVYHAGSVGVDGLFLLEQLKKEKVNVAHVTVLEETRTGNAIIQNDRDGDNCIILFGGANQAITAEQIEQVFVDFQEGDYILLQNEINRMPDVMERAHAAGMKIALNPSPMNHKIFELPLELVDIFLLNEIEAGQLLGIKDTQKLSGEDMAQQLHQKYPKAEIVLTLGDAGSIYIDRKTFISQRKYDVKAVDTTAAGDTFTGYFLGSVLQGYSKQEAMDRAAKASAIAVTRCGAASSIPEMNEVTGFEEN